MSGPMVASAFPTAALGHVAEVTLGKMIQSNPVDGARTVPYIKARNVRPDRVEVHSLGEMYATPGEVAQLTVQQGDIFVIEGGATAGRAAVVLDEPPQDAIFQNAVHRVRAGDHLDQRFLYYVLAAYPATGWYEAICSAATFKHLTGEKMARLQVPVPSLEVQRRVADMLDAETARIDTLITKNQRATELATAHRESLISRRVSGGLDAIDPQLATAVDAPTGWRLTRLKYATTKLTVGIVVKPADLYVDDGTGVICLRGLNVKRGHVRQVDLRWISHEGHAANPSSHLAERDIVMVRTGEAGAAAVVPDWAVGGNCVDLLVVRPDDGLVPKFLELLLNSEFVRRQVQRFSVGSIQSHFNVGTLADVVIAYPDIDRQRQIVVELESDIARVDALLGRIQNLRKLLRLRRQALITAAVTGQVDV